MKLEAIQAAVMAANSSLNKHYWTVFSIAYGLQTKTAFEFGAGTSSAVLLTALDLTGGKLISCELEPLDSLVARTPALREYTPSSNWTYWNASSKEALERLTDEGFELVLHDGSHEAHEVEQDIAGILPRLKRFGVLLVHDVEQFQLGPQMRRGLLEGIRQSGLQVSMTSLPYADGLAILRMESETGRGQIARPWSGPLARPTVPLELPWQTAGRTSSTD